MLHICDEIFDPPSKRVKKIEIFPIWAQIFQIFYVVLILKNKEFFIF